MLKTMIGTSIALALLGASVPILADEGTTDGFPPARNLSYTDVPGADQAITGTNAVLGDAHLFLAGSAFTPRTSAQAVTYPGGGCLYSDGVVNTSLDLPTGAVINGVRLYYYSTASTSKVEIILNTFTGGGSFSNLLDKSSNFSSGYTNEYFALSTPASVDNYAKSYALVAATDADARFCGVRVFYTL